MALLKFLEQGLKNTDSGLGDRSKYIGSSDIGQCPKKAFFGKKTKETHELKQLLIFERGHVAEGIVRNGLANNPHAISFKEQVEIQGTGKLSYIKTHIDFIVDFPQECVVIECKTISSPLPNNQPRESWIYQVQLQLGLLRATSNRECRGIIVAFNLNTGEAFEFNVDYNEKFFNIAVDRASSLWESVQSNIEPEGEIGDLCTYCSFKSQCQTLQRNGEQLPQEVEQMAMRLKELKPLENEAKNIKDNIKAFMESANLKKGIGREISLVMQSRKGRETVSISDLRGNYPEIANQVIKNGESFKTLMVV